MLVPRIARAIGFRRLFLAVAATAATVAALYAAVVAPPPWWTLRLVNGFCLACLFLVIESWLNETASNATRGRAVATYHAVNFAFSGLGPFLLIVADPASLAPFAVVAVFFLLTMIPLRAAPDLARAPLPTVAFRPVLLFRTSPVAFVGACGLGLSNAAFWTMGAWYAVQRGFPTTEVALLMAVAAVAGAITPYPIARLSDRVDRRRVLMIVCCAAAAASLAIVGTTPLGPGWLLPAAFVFGASISPIYPLLLAHGADRTAQGTFVETSSSMSFIYAIGAVLGPLAASAAMARLGPSGLFLHTAAVYVLMAGFAGYRLWRDRVAPGAPAAAP